MEAKMITTKTIKSTSFSNGPSKIDDPGDLFPPPYFLHGGKDDRLTSHEVVKKIRVELRYLDDEIRDHLYIRMLGQKKVDLPTLRAFPGHQYHIINSDLRSIAMMIHRFSKPSIQSFFRQVFQGGVEALTNLLPLAQKLGMSGVELQRYPITPEGFAYSTYMGWLSMYGSAAEIAAGFRFPVELFSLGI
jgi:thiaminase